MQKSHFSLAWDKFHSSMCAGFSLLQQNGELVDMTLAADGHMVKVHQIVLGVASPFIKELLQSVDCKHPVIFLNNVSYPILCNILEYVYTGEVSLSEENLGTFFSTAKALLIRGLEEMTSTPGTDTSLKGKISSESQTTLPTTLPSQIKLPTKFIKILPKQVDAEIKPEKTVGTSVLKSSAVKRKIPVVTLQSDTKKRTIKDQDVDDGSGDDSGGNQDEHISDDFELTGLVESSQQTLQKSTDGNNSTKPLSEMQYTVSNRGCLQLILNRFLYNLYSRSSGGRIRRWRCVDYRDHRCPAAATTDNNVIVRRSNLHNHPFHDKKILAKIDKKAVFSAIKAVSNSQNPILE